MQRENTLPSENTGDAQIQLRPLDIKSELTISKDGKNNNLSKRPSCCQTESDMVVNTTEKKQ